MTPKAKFVATLIIIAIPIVLVLASGLYAWINRSGPENQQQPIVYTSEKSDQLVEKIKNKPTLPARDAQIRTQLVAIAKDHNGTILTNPNYTISYLSTFDLFEVEITSQNIGQAHLEATKWFLNKGLGQSAVCNLPVSFFVAKDTSSLSQEVNPLPDGC